MLLILPLIPRRSWIDNWYLTRDSFLAFLPTLIRPPVAYLLVYRSVRVLDSLLAVHHLPFVPLHRPTTVCGFQDMDNYPPKNGTKVFETRFKHWPPSFPSPAISWASRHQPVLMRLSLDTSWLFSLLLSMSRR